MGAKRAGIYDTVRRASLRSYVQASDNDVSERGRALEVRGAGFGE